MLKASARGIFKPSVGFGQEEIPVSPRSQSFLLRWETAGSRLKEGIFHNLGELKERTDLNQDFCTNIRGGELRKEKFRPRLERQMSKIRPRAPREDCKEPLYSKTKYSRWNCGIHIMACAGASDTWLTHHFSQSECHLNNNYSLGSSINFYQKRWWQNQRKASSSSQPVSKLSVDPCVSKFSL